MCGHIRIININKNVHAKTLNKKNLSNLFKLVLCKYIIFEAYIPQDIQCTLYYIVHILWIEWKMSERVFEFCWSIIPLHANKSNLSKASQQKKTVHTASENPSLSLSWCFHKLYKPGDTSLDRLNLIGEFIWDILYSRLKFEWFCTMSNF